MLEHELEKHLGLGGLNLTVSLGGLVLTLFMLWQESSILPTRSYCTD